MYYFVNDFITFLSFLPRIVGGPNIMQENVMSFSNYLIYIIPDSFIIRKIQRKSQPCDKSLMAYCIRKRYIEHVLHWTKIVFKNFRFLAVQVRKKFLSPTKLTQNLCFSVCVIAITCTLFFIPPPPPPKKKQERKKNNWNSLCGNCLHNYVLLNS